MTMLNQTYLYYVNTTATPHTRSIAKTCFCLNASNQAQVEMLCNFRSDMGVMNWDQFWETGREFSRDPGSQTHRKSLLELPVFTFQVELLSGFPVNKDKLG